MIPMCDDQKDMGPARAQGTRRAGRARGYPSDLTDAQWQVIAAHLPAERPGRRGRPRIWPAAADHRGDLVPGPHRLRLAVSARRLPALADRLLATSPPGAMMAPWPGCTPSCAPRSGSRPGAQPQPTAAVIDSQSVRAADTVPRASRGWDAAKKVNGRKRHIAVDTTGLILDVVITPASVQDRHGARPLLWNTHRACPPRPPDLG